jgi:hypothetical protein
MKQFYWADVRFIYPTPVGMRETSMMIEYAGTEPLFAVKSAIRFARERERCLAYIEKYTFSSIHVGVFRPQSISPKGEYRSPRSHYLFEWKIDFPGKIEDYLGALAKLDRFMDGRLFRRDG